MKLTIQLGGHAAPLGPAEKVSFTLSNGVRREYRVLSYTQEAYYLGHRAEVFELDALTAEQEPVVDRENMLLRLRRIRELLASNNAGQMMEALQQVDDLIDDLR